MSDDIKAVAQEILDRTEGQIGTHSTDCHKYHLACFAAFVADALEAVQQTPAVDREALAHEVARWLPVTMQDPDEWALDRARLIVQWLIASGILQDAAEVEARGARAGYEAGYTNGGYDQTDRSGGIAPSRIEFDAELTAYARAQQVREGNA